MYNCSSTVSLQMTSVNVNYFLAVTVFVKYQFTYQILAICKTFNPMKYVLHFDMIRQFILLIITAFIVKSQSNRSSISLLRQIAIRVEWHIYTHIYFIKGSPICVDPFPIQCLNDGHFSPNNAHFNLDNENSPFPLVRMLSPADVYPSGAHADTFWGEISVW